MRVYIGPYPDSGDGEPEVNVQIDDYDVWAMDYTLSKIIHPMLVRLKEQSHGCGMVDLEDVPEELQVDDPKVNDWDSGSNHFSRWDWIMDEMIWAFGQLAEGGDYQEQFRSGEIDMNWVPSKQDVGIGPLYECEYGPNHTYKLDEDGLKAHEARMENGFRLFGKYYRNLWD
jgi:hypothetical protein